MKRKGIILAGGSGSRLYPVTSVVSKQLLPVFDKPMIYYPLSVLMLTGIKEILIISKPEDKLLFENLLGDGSAWGLSIEYTVQNSPDGLAQALIIAEDFLSGSPSALVLGDNIFYGQDISKILEKANSRKTGATIFAYHVENPKQYGVVKFNSDGKIVSIEEKPSIPDSNYVVTGLYFYDKNAVQYAKSVKPSKRGELEITDLNRVYLEDQKLFAERLNRGYSWLDMGTYDSLAEANQFVRIIQNRTGLKIACPEEIAFRKKWISKIDLVKLAQCFINNHYGEYLIQISKEDDYEDS